ncbi:hypothetical protein Ciccas_004577 [Cichlidogyrus casuarinus]|uniref:Uncharacterized protein n=1 Tax=Cichlidogyrus casuarinus TaxID=1844966 RepID=A0ABD2QB46_9PLAT
MLGKELKGIETENQPQDSDLAQKNELLKDDKCDDEGIMLDELVNYNIGGKSKLRINDRLPFLELYTKEK